MKSHLPGTGAENLSPGLADGLLGNAHQRKNRGRFADLAPGQLQQMTVLELTGDDQLAAGCQVACSVVPLESQGFAQNSLAVPSLLGTLVWGTDGANQELQFDWLQGVTLSVSCSYLRIGVQRNSIVDEEVPTSVRVGASLGYFPHSPGLRRTFVNRGVEVDGLIENPIPAFAREVQIIQSPQAAIVVAQLDRTGFPLAIESSAYGVRMPILPDAASVSVLNTSGAEQNQISTVYHLWV